MLQQLEERLGLPFLCCLGGKEQAEGTKQRMFAWQMKGFAQK